MATMHQAAGTALNVQAHDDLICDCGDYLTILETAYGYRAHCRGCRIRWTLINGEPRWIAEPYSGMEDNLRH